MTWLLFLLGFVLYFVYSAVFFERPYEIAAAVFAVGFTWLLITINYAMSTQGFYKMVTILQIFQTLAGSIPGDIYLG